MWKPKSSLTSWRYRVTHELQHSLVREDDTAAGCLPNSFRRPSQPQTIGTVVLTYEINMLAHDSDYNSIQKSSHTAAVQQPVLTPEAQARLRYRVSP